MTDVAKETKNLTEVLKVDFAALAKHAFPKAKADLLAEIKSHAKLGILKRMDETAGILLTAYGPEVVETLAAHQSDTARGWAAFVIGRLPKMTLAKRLSAVRAYADDSHFGVREWAWMAVRPHIATELPKAIELLTKWTGDESPRVRRFASEATRPRGVWAAHIAALKDDPALGLPILTPLRDDPERYVQDSVANWLNDAAKSQPDWVGKLCATWGKGTVSKERAYILKRAQRSL